MILLDIHDLVVLKSSGSWRSQKSARCSLSFESASTGRSSERCSLDVSLYSGQETSPSPLGFLQRYTVCNTTHSFHWHHLTSVFILQIPSAIRKVNYVQHQSPVFYTFIDATEAFDIIKYCKLYKLFLQRYYRSLLFWFLLIYTQIIWYVFLGIVRCSTVL